MTSSLEGKESKEGMRARYSPPSLITTATGFGGVGNPLEAAYEPELNKLNMEPCSAKAQTQEACPDARRALKTFRVNRLGQELGVLDRDDLTVPDEEIKEIES